MYLHKAIEFSACNMVVIAKLEEIMYDDWC